MDGYKAFDSNLKANGVQFVMGETHTLVDPSPLGTNFYELIKSTCFGFSLYPLDVITSDINTDTALYARVHAEDVSQIVQIDDDVYTDKLNVVSYMTYPQIVAAMDGTITRSNGDVEVWRNGSLHNLTGPAITKANGDKFYYKNGKLHRDADLPAKEYANGDKEWYTTGKCTRAGNPAVVRTDGTEIWYTLGKIERLLDLCAYKTATGTQMWYVGGELHRDTDFPSIIQPDGSVWYYKSGKLERGNDLPAVILADGTQMWYTNGKNNRPSSNLPDQIMADGSRYWHNQGVLVKSKKIVKIK